MAQEELETLTLPAPSTLQRRRSCFEGRPQTDSAAKVSRFLLSVCEEGTGIEILGPKEKKKRKKKILQEGRIKDQRPEVTF